MSFVIAVPELVTTAASDLVDIGSTISAANNAAAAPTVGVLAAGADEVSAQIAALFGAHAQGYRALSAQAAAFHEQFVGLCARARRRMRAARPPTLFLYRPCSRMRSTPSMHPRRRCLGAR